MRGVLVIFTGLGGGRGSTLWLLICRGIGSGFADDAGGRIGSTDAREEEVGDSTNTSYPP